MIITCTHLNQPTAGKYPVEAVAMMNRVCLEAEAAMFHNVVFSELRKLTPIPTNTVHTIAIASVDASFQQNAAAILTLTTTGKTAFAIAQFRPRCPIIAVTRNPRTARLVWQVTFFFFFVRSMHTYTQSCFQAF